MTEANFYQKQYAYLLRKIDQALSALDGGLPLTAQAILLVAIQESEERYIRDGPK